MSVTAVEAMSGPDPEVRPAHQVYAVAYKLWVLGELDSADSKSERSEILRRWGLYWSVVSEWRKQRDRGALEALRQKHPGRKGDPLRAENARLRARVEDLEGRLQVTEELIDAQGKVSALLQKKHRKSAGEK